MLKIFLSMLIVLATSAPPAFSNSLHIQVKNEAATGTSAAGIDAYGQDLMRRLAAAFVPPICSQSKLVQVDFDVAKNGTMSNPTIVVSSKIPILDESVLKAVNLAAPTFRALPEGSPATVHFSAEFDYVIGVNK